jgi:hypothetical protein
MSILENDISIKIKHITNFEQVLNFGKEQLIKFKNNNDFIYSGNNLTGIEGCLKYEIDNMIEINNYIYTTYSSQHNNLYYTPYSICGNASKTFLEKIIPQLDEKGYMYILHTPDYIKKKIYYNTIKYSFNLLYKNINHSGLNSIVLSEETFEDSIDKEKMKNRIQNGKWYKTKLKDYIKKIPFHYNIANLRSVIISDEYEKNKYVYVKLLQLFCLYLPELEDNHEFNKDDKKYRYEIDDTFTELKDDTISEIFIEDPNMYNTDLYKELIKICKSIE